jgi:hypothetical protein
LIEAGTRYRHGDGSGTGPGIIALKNKADRAYRVVRLDHATLPTTGRRRLCVKP